MLPPGPRLVPILGLYGNILPFMRDPVLFLRHLFRTYGEIVSLAQGTTDYLFAFAPQYNQQILSQPKLFEVADADKAPIRFYEGTALKRLFANGLNQMNEPRHKEERRLMMPAFHKARIEGYREQIVTLTERHLAGWQVGERLNLLHEMRELTAAIATATLLGLDPAREGQATLQMFEQWQKLFFNPLTILLPFRLPFTPYKRLLSLSERLEQALQAMIEGKRASGQLGEDVLAMLLSAHDEAGSKMSDQGLLAQALTLFVAGHETTAAALTWTLFLLEQHPAILADLLDELESTLHGNAPTAAQLHDLPLLEAVIKESLRLFPPFYLQLRIAAQPFELGTYTLPAGSTVAISSFITHHHPAIYPQPDTFLPQRWQQIKPTAYQYLPFSAASRMCLGATFAMFEMRLVLPLILQQYRLALPPHTKVNRSTGPTFLVPKGGLPMTVHRQDRQFAKSDVRGNVRDVVAL